MELVLRWDRKEHDPHENADVFAFEVREPQHSKHLQIWIPEEVQEALRERFGDDWAIMQAALGRAMQHLGAGALDKPLENVWVEGDNDPLEGVPVSGVDLHCHHLTGRDRSARCQIDSDQFDDNPARCVPGKNACWRQICVTD